eukprot:CAMPEP_0179123346 /NCGR_PEP_ID=MMETSP0796-20121207/58250_1 /TAXON_ID=73915 /ORGANISM="Pyrodinium bahamense, Strain pbaha01" /LENGTH=176 /DNA_ID=CAMNT_0020821989 /DNA_START=182 /DNA_END=713 /DNA_ORIENTATION=-
MRAGHAAAALLGLSGLMFSILCFARMAPSAPLARLTSDGHDSDSQQAQAHAPPVHVPEIKSAGLPWFAVEEGSLDGERRLWGWGCKVNPCDGLRCPTGWRTQSYCTHCGCVRDMPVRACRGVNDIAGSARSVALPAAPMRTGAGLSAEAGALGVTSAVPSVRAMEDADRGAGSRYR